MLADSFFLHITYNPDLNEIYIKIYLNMYCAILREKSKKTLKRNNLLQKDVRPRLKEGHPTKSRHGCAQMAQLKSQWNDLKIDAHRVSV